MADGVAEQILNRLSRNGDLRVAARESSFMFRDSDKPVTGAQTLDIKTAPTDPTRIAAQQKQAEDQEAADSDAQKKADEAAKLTQTDAKKREENCQKARVRLSAITGAQRPYRTQVDGERHYLSSEEIDGEIKDAEAGVSQWCGS